MWKILILSLFFFTPLLGDENTNAFSEAAVGAQNYSYLGEFINMMITLGFILTLILVSVWFLKRIMRSRIQNLNRSNGIKILERRSLGPKTSLYLVDILGKGVVISESQTGIRVVTEFSEGVQVEKLLEQLQEEKPARESFRESFSKKLKRISTKNLSFGLSSSESEEFTPQILGFSDKVNGRRPNTRQKSTRDASKVPESEGEKPKAQVNNA